MKLKGTINRIVGASKLAMIASMASLGVGAGVIGGVGVTYGPQIIGKAKAPEGEAVEIGTTSGEEEEKVGFTLGEFDAADPVQSIKVTLKVGASGEELKEKVDLHLGTGFPLRLYPLGDDSREPAFAAFPQKSTLERGENSIAPGESATFEFAVSGEAGQDSLKSTPQLLKDLTIGDLDSIGFASRGQSAWILESYQIEVNGKPFGSHDSANLQPQAIQAEYRSELESAVPANEVLLKEISTLETYVAAGLAGESDKADLATKKAEVAKTAGPLNLLAGQNAGYYPWYVEEDEKFTTAVGSGAAEPVGEVEITLVAGGGDKAGTRNPMYIKAGGKKFLLTSEADPLADMEEPQEFTISLADLKSSPLAKDDLKSLGIGVVGNEERFGTVPDRAKLQRLFITADGKKIYDSESKTSDRRALEAYWLVPPVHLDETGNAVENLEKDDEKYLWISGMTVPADALAKNVTKPVEVSAVATTAAASPDALPILVAPDVPSLTTVDADPAKILTSDSTGSPPPLPGGGTTVATGKGKGEKGTTGTSPPPPLPGTTTAPPIGTTTAPILGATAPPVTLGTVTPTRATAAPSGTFVATGVPDPSTGLIGGVLTPATQAASTGTTFAPFRRNTSSTGGLSPAVFNPPATTVTTGTSAAQPRLTGSEISQIASSLANVIRPFFGNNSTAATTATTGTTATAGTTGTAATTTTTGTTTQPSVKVSNVRFNQNTADVHDGDTIVVEWDAYNTAKVSGFRVELMPCFPERKPAVPDKAKPVGTMIVNSSSATEARVDIALNTTTMGTIPKEDWLHVYLQPMVTPLDLSTPAKSLGGGERGRIVPVLPKKSFATGKAILRRGISVRPVGNTSSVIGSLGSYQLFDNVSPNPVNHKPWRRMANVMPAGNSSAFAKLLTPPIRSLPPMEFHPNELLSTSVFHSAGRTSGVANETGAIVFEGVVSYDVGNQSQVGVAGSGVRRGYRLIGHLGFLSEGIGAATPPGSANVNLQVELSNVISVGSRLDRQIRAPLNVERNLAWELQDPPSGQRKIPFFTHGPDNPFTVPNSRSSAKPLQLIDVPIRFDQLDVGEGGAFPFPYETTTNFTSPPAMGNFATYTSAKSKQGLMTITVTLMIETPKDGGSLGVYGLRVVPDVYY